ncbi:immunoglobulin-like domain-containing protein [Oceanobacillus sp. CAU 1775]
MKKHTLIYGILLVLILMGCGTSMNGKNASDFEPTSYESINDLNGVTMQVVEETVSPLGLSVRIENNSDNRVVFSDDFLLEMKIAEDWFQVPIKLESYGFNDIGYEVEPGASEEWPANFEWLYGSLEDGDYRIFKKVLDFRGPGDFDEYDVAAEFTINEAS